MSPRIRTVNQLELTCGSLPVWEGATLTMGYKYLHADPTAEQQDDDLGNHDYSDCHTSMLELRQTVMGTLHLGSWLLPQSQLTRRHIAAPMASLPSRNRPEATRSSAEMGSP